jgi:hypothetical protein
LPGELRESVDFALAVNTAGKTVPQAFEGGSIAAAETAATVSPAALLLGTEMAAQSGIAGFASPIASAVAMPSAEMLQSVLGKAVEHQIIDGSEGDPKVTGEFARVLADALIDVRTANLDALLNALPGEPGDIQAIAVASWNGSSLAAFNPAQQFDPLEALAVHFDALPAA